MKNKYDSRQKKKKETEKQYLDLLNALLKIIFEEKM
jgi:hypothetical protein